jgi:hypothetical protein
MTVLIQQRRGLVIRRLAMMANYRPKAGGFKNALSKLRKREWIEGRGEVGATAKGIHEFGPVPKLPTGDALFEYWLRHPRVDKCARAILNALRDAERALGNEELAQLAGYTTSTGGGFKNSRSTLRTLGLIQGRGEITLAEDLQRARAAHRR